MTKNKISGEDPDTMIKNYRLSRGNQNLQSFSHKKWFAVICFFLAQTFRQFFLNSCHPIHISFGQICKAQMSYSPFKDVRKIRSELASLRLLTKRASDILECRIDGVLAEMAMVSLCNLPEEDPITWTEFLQITEDSVRTAAESLAK